MKSSTNSILEKKIQKKMKILKQIAVNLQNKMNLIQISQLIQEN